MSGELPARQITPEEIALARDKHQHEFGMRNIELYAQDRREEREFFAGNRKATLTVALAVTTGISIFFIAALFLNKDTLLIDLLKILAGAFGGGGIGYMFGFRRGKQPNQ